MTSNHQKLPDRFQLLDPDCLLAALDPALPGFAAAFGREQSDDGDPEPPTVHAVMREFRSTFREDRATDDELEAMARLIGLSVEARDDLENAMMTCFVEHGGIGKRLRDRLGANVKAYIRTN